MVAPVARRFLLTTAEVARMLGVSRRRVASLAAAPGFPESVKAISEGRLFDRRAVEEWAAINPDRGPVWERRNLPLPGEMAPGVQRVRKLATAQAAELNHHWVGDVHLLLALLHPDCSGAARAALEAFGLAFGDVRRSFVDRLGRTFDAPPAGQTYHHGTQRLLEEANFGALELQDDKVDSEHVLLALAHAGKASATYPFLAEAGVDSAALRGCVIELTEATTTVCQTPSPTGSSNRSIHASELARVLGGSRREVVQLAFSAPDFPSSEVASEGYRVWPRHLVEAWVAARPEREVGPGGLKPATASGLVPLADEVLRLARARAEELDHSWVVPDHLLLAVLHPDCPGKAREVLESLGTDLEEAQRMWVESMGDPFEPPGRPPADAPTTHDVLDRAKIKAIKLEDEAITGEHVLLALADDWERVASIHLIRRGIDAEAVRRRLIALNDGLMPAPPPSPPAHWRRVAKRIPRPPELELALSPAGHDPRRRRPWGSRMLRDATGQTIYEGRALCQYFIDRDGYPVRTTCGRLVRGLDDENGMPVLDEEGGTFLTTLEEPPGFETQRSRRRQ